MATWQQAYDYCFAPGREDKELKTAAIGLRLPPGPMTREAILQRLQVAYDAETNKNSQSPWTADLRAVKQNGNAKPTPASKPKPKAKTWKCSNGHPSPANAEFCSKCGERKGKNGGTVKRNDGKKSSFWTDFVNAYNGR